MWNCELETEGERRTKQNGTGFTVAGNGPIMFSARMKWRHLQRGFQISATTAKTRTTITTTTTTTTLNNSNSDDNKNNNINNKNNYNPITATTTATKINSANHDHEGSTTAAVVAIFGNLGRNAPGIIVCKQKFIG